jgi:RHS repeat-associated protein
MTSTDHQALWSEACLASRAACWPTEMGPRNPQASYYRARYYDPATGRFLNEDPIRFRGGVNFYAYVDNSVTNRTDPRGKGFVDCAKALAELAAATINVDLRLADMIAHAGSPDPMQHRKALSQAVNRLNNALQLVVTHCSCYVAEAIILIKAAEQLLEEVAPYVEELE